MGFEIHTFNTVANIQKTHHQCKMVGEKFHLYEPGVGTSSLTFSTNIVRYQRGRASKKITATHTIIIAVSRASKYH